MRLVSNPLVLHMVIASAVLLFSCVAGLLGLRRLRHSMVAGTDPCGAVADSQPFPLLTYHAVIQQLKQQKHELLSEQQAERRRAKTSENISATVLSHLSSGVMFFAPNGLVRQANGAAKNILGFASLVGMNAEAVFRQASPTTSRGQLTSVAAAVLGSLQQKGSTQSLEAHYVTPTGAQRMLEMTITTVCAPSGDVLGTACLINDRTDVARMQKQQQLHDEMSAEMALALRSSLATLSGHARQVVAAHDLERAQELATDIIAEAAELDHTIGGFLAGGRNTIGVAGD